MISINPFTPNELFYLNSLDRSISSRRDVWVDFIITMFYRNSCILCKQCRLWSDAAFCGVWSGSTLLMSLLGEAKYKWANAFIVSFNLDTKESLTLSARQTKIDTCANSVDLDGTETSRLIRIYTVCHSKFDFRLKPLFASVDVSMFKDESPLQKLRDERVNYFVSNSVFMLAWKSGYSR